MSTTDPQPGLRTADPVPGATLRTRRLAAAAVALPCAAVLTVGAYLQPSSAGIGTHTGLGLPPCGFHEVTGLPCATCGCTTAFAYACDGRLLAAIHTQPFGAAAAMLCAVLVIVSGYAAWRGLSLALLGRLIGNPKVILLLGGLVLASWGYKTLLVLGYVP